MLRLKTKTLMIPLVLLIVLSTVNAYARVNCAHDLAMLHLATKTQSPAIMDFYFESSDRFLNKEIKSLTPHRGKTILGKKTFIIPVDGNENMQLHLFHNFENTLNGDSYAALLGVSVVNTRVFETGPEGLFQFQQQSFMLARDQGFNLPLIFNQFKKDGKQIAVYQYLHGPNLDQIEQLYLKGELSKESMRELREGYQSILDQFTFLKETDQYRRFASQFGELHLHPKNIINYDGQWYVLEFSKH